MRRQLQAPSIRPTLDSGRCLTLGLLAAVACLALMALGAGSARAEIVYADAGLTGDGFLGGWPEVNSGIAIEESHGYVLVVQQTAGRVTVLDSDQPSATPIASFGEGELSSPTGIAIDQTDGSIYISDAGNNRIVRYTSDGATPPTYTLDNTYTSPAQGTGLGEVGDFAAQLAIDPSTGDLLVADTGNKRVERFDSSGAFLDSFDGADAPGGAFTSLLDIAITPAGDIYVVANGTSFADVFNVETTGSVVERFAADGSFAEDISFQQFGPSARAVAFDPRTQSLLVARSLSGPASNLAVIRGGKTVQETFYGGNGHAVDDLASPQSGTGAVLSLNFASAYQGGAAARLVFFDLEPKIGPASAITGTSAHLSGTVNPHDATEVAAHFEFRPAGQTNWNSTPDQSVPATATAEPVEADLSGLLPARQYEVRLTVARPGASVTSGVISFETEAVAPVAMTQGATGIRETAATLNGSVTAEGAPTTYLFEYGTTSAYGAQAPAAEASAGSGRAPHRFSVDVTDLIPGTTYHYRLIAKNSAGTSFGEDLEFTTAVTSPAGRAYEQVTPVDQQGGNINGGLGIAALPGGRGISYVATPPGGDVDAAPIYPRMLSLRGETDWEDPIRVDPPYGSAQGLVMSLTAAVSDDGTHALVVSNRALTPGAREGYDVMNLYLKDLRDGSYTFISSVDGLQQAHRLQFDARTMITEASPSFSWIVFWSRAALMPGAPEGFTESTTTQENEGGLYRWSEDGGLEVVSLNSQPTLVTKYEETKLAPRQVSDDGLRVFFQATTGVYLWEGDQTAPVSVSELDDTVKPATLFASSRSGRYVFFTSTRLTPDAPEEGLSLYRYDVETQTLELVSAVGSPATVPSRLLGASEDGSTVYIIPGAGGATKVWRNGQLSTLPPPIEGPTGGGPGKLQVSPNGRYAGIYQYGNIYLYDAETQELSCASCEAGSPTFSASTPTATESYERYGSVRAPQWVGDEGQVYFTTPASLVPEDVNGVKDAYEFQDGSPHLISPGNAANEATFLDMSGEGQDVYFLTSQALVARDTNRSADIYDARPGGGFPVQNMVPSPPCAGEACQAPAGAAPAPAAAGSEAVTAIPSKKHKKAKRCKGKQRTSGKKARKACHSSRHGASKGKRR
ncbi:MAG TPA: hypothetical protein VFP17_12515 [Solirubrobacterales bacterium]|nr:hypothetical protein [Solirubrobacterales bacterium]